MAKLIAGAGLAACIGVCVLGGCWYLMSFFGRPPQPVAFGTILWSYETGFTVSNVSRSDDAGGMTRYAVTARVFCPFGERYTWTPRSAHVIDNDGRAYYAVSATPEHKILGASDTEHLIFRLPRNIEQPALVFDHAMGFAMMFGDFERGIVSEPHRFNLRYD